MSAAGSDRDRTCSEEFGYAQRPPRTGSRQNPRSTSTWDCLDHPTLHANGESIGAIGGPHLHIRAPIRRSEATNVQLGVQRVA